MMETKLARRKGFHNEFGTLWFGERPLRTQCGAANRNCAGEMGETPGAIGRMRLAFVAENAQSATLRVKHCRVRLLLPNVLVHHAAPALK
jgi:hypothetical protein